MFARGRTSHDSGTPVQRGLIITLLGAVVGSVLVTAGPSGAYDRPYKTTRVDIATSGEGAGEGRAGSPSISRDGRFIAFDHSAGDLVPGDLNVATDVFVRDTTSGKTELISRTPQGLAGMGVPLLDAPGGGDPGLAGSISFDASIDATGRYVAFSSVAVDLVPGDTNLVADIFVFDRRRQEMERISVDSNGDQTDGLLGSFLPSINGNGRFVSFTSGADDLVEGDENDFPDVFVHDRNKERTIRVSVDSGGRESSGSPCFVPVPQETVEDTLEDVCDGLIGTVWPTSSISSDGRQVVFDSMAGDLIENDLNDISDVFVHDRKSRKTTLVSADINGDAARLHPLSLDTTGCKRMGSSLGGPPRFNDLPPAHAVSANGRFVVFASNAFNLVPYDTTNPRETSGDLCRGGTDIFVRDLKTRRTERVSVEADGREINRTPVITDVFGSGGDTLTPSISSDGNSVAFYVFCVGCASTKGTTYWRPSETGRYRGTLATFHRPTGAVAVTHAIPRDENDYSFNFWQAQPDINGNGRYMTFRSQELGKDRSRFGGSTGGLLAPRHTVIRWDWGLPSGIVRWGGAPTSEEAPDDRICINGICIPPGAPFPGTDAGSRGLSAATDLIGASLTHRPQFGDLLLVQELEHLSQLVPGGSGRAGDPSVVLGLHFELEGRKYEVRASSLDGGTFGLFDCTASALPCSKVTDLNGGYGTTGHRVVVALPLDAIGAESGAELSDARAFSALGTLSSGPARILDSIRF